MKKKRLLFAITLLFSAVSLQAQESPFVGTWEGTLTMPVPDSNFDEIIDYQYKIIVRINQYGDDFGVRMKTISLEDPSKVRYFDNTTVTSSTPTSLTWNCKLNTSYDCGYVVNGQMVYSADYSCNYKVVFNNGRLFYTESMHTIYKGRSGGVIGTHDNPTSGNIYLYKQEADW